MYSKEMTRRTFLGAAASVVAVPYVITSSPLGAGGKRRITPSERMNMGFIGLGG